MAFHKRWDEMTDDEKLEVIDPVLDNIKSVLLNKDTLNCSISTFSDDEKPEIRDGSWKMVNVPYEATDTIEIKIKRIKMT